MARDNHTSVMAGDWQTKPMPKKQRVLELEHRYSKEEFAMLKLGLIPREMEDHWFVCFASGTVYIHRSWTGYCIYMVEVMPQQNGAKLFKVIVNANNRQYKGMDDEDEKQTVLSVLDMVIRYNREVKGGVCCLNAGTMNNFIAEKGDMHVESPDYDLTDAEMEELDDDFTRDEIVLLAEKSFCKELEAEYQRLTTLYSSLSQKWRPDMGGNEITQAIILRMKTYYETREKVRLFLKRQNISPAPDVFVETVVFYLKLVLEKVGSKLTVCSEKKLKPKRGAMKPDISVWKKGRCVAIIECKTNLGWNRQGWEDDFHVRENALNLFFPKAKAFLVVLSAVNWDGFGEKNGVGTQFFTLSNCGMRDIKKKQKRLKEVVQNPIEGLFGQILELG